MATSGTIKTTYKGWTYRMYWSAKQSPETNKSTITIDHWLDCADSYDLYISSRKNDCTVVSKQTFESAAISTTGGTSIKLGTTTHTVTHSADGSAQGIVFEGNFYIKATLDGTYKEVLTARGSYDLDTIPRASQPSCVTWPEHTQNVGNFGDKINIFMNRKSTSFTHTVRYAYGVGDARKTGTIAEGVTNNTTWVIPLNFMDNIPNTTYGSGTIHVDTYNGTQLVGTKSCGFTANVPAYVKPTCSIQVLDATDTQAKYGNLVKGLSKLYVKTIGTPAYKSPIASYAVTANGKSYTAAEITTDVLTAAGTTTISATVTDKRGRKSAAASTSFTVLDYKEPTISELSVHRVTEPNGAEDDQGGYVQVYFQASITALNNKNSAAYKVRYKKTTDSNWTEVALSALAGKYSVLNYYYYFAADVDYSYDVQIVATDNIKTRTRATTVSTGQTLMDWNDDGKSLAFGKVSEESGALENALALKQIGNRFAASSTGTAGTAGYVRIAQLTHIQPNADSPITFVFTQRLASTPMTVHVQFKTDSTTTDPALEGITYEGDNYGAFLVKSAASVWDLYVQKVTGYDTITLQDWFMSNMHKGRMEVKFPGDLVSELPQGLVGWYRATPAKLQNILDFVYPVGSIYLSYSQTSPATLFGGVWVRIKNTFLWACDEDGEIGLAGGEKTHTLTVDELPAHSHGIAVAHEPTGSTSLSGGTITYRNTGGTTSYLGSLVTKNTGGAKAHNNMPPYIQVAIWRRTS